MSEPRFVPNEEQLRDWQEWLDQRPPAIKAVAERLPPWEKLVLKTTGQLAQVTAYDEHDDGHVSVKITVWRTWLPLAHGVFGVNPDDLVLLEGNEELLQ